MTRCSCPGMASRLSRLSMMCAWRWTLLLWSCQIPLGRVAVPEMLRLMLPDEATPIPLCPLLAWCIATLSALLGGACFSAAPLNPNWFYWIQIGYIWSWGLFQKRFFSISWKVFSAISLRDHWHCHSEACQSSASSSHALWNSNIEYHKQVFQYLKNLKIWQIRNNLET